MIGKTVEFNLGKQEVTGVILDKVLDNVGSNLTVTYYLIEHSDGSLSMIRPVDITRIVQQPGIGHKPIQTK